MGLTPLIYFGCIVLPKTTDDMKIHSFQKNRNWLLTIVLLLCFHLHSQERKEIFDSTLWIKAKEIINSDIPNSNTNAENELKKYFNFNPTVNFTKDKFKKEYRNLVKKQSTLFVVFKTSSKEDDALLLMNQSGSKTFFSTKKIQSDEDLSLNKGNVQKGMILTYTSNKNSILSSKKGSITIDDLFLQDDTGKNQMMELIYIPRILNQLEQNKVESYLSVKYGISLIGDKDYYNSEGKKIWDFKNNSSNNFRVTGIGRDDTLGLYQKQSGNYEKDGLYIGLNSIKETNASNSTKIDNLTYLIWGDNNESTVIKENEGKHKKMKRVWKAQVFGGSNSFVSTQLILNREEMMLGDLDAKDHSVWLAIDTTQNGQFNFKSAYYIRAETVENKFVFDKVIFKNNTPSLFTFIKSTDFFIEEDIMVANCNLGQDAKMKINIVGGNAPYKIKLTSGDFNMQIETDKQIVEVENLVNGDYFVEVTDAASRVQKSLFTIDGFIENPITLQKEWVLNQNGQVIIKPTLEKDSPLDYQWFFGDKLVSTEKEPTVTIAGNYQLVVTSKDGCKKAFDFAVYENGKAIKGDWIIYPNPASPIENFTVKLMLDTTKKVVITIYDENGRMIKNSDLGLIKQHEHKDSLRVSGTYLVVMTINGETQTSKLIIK